MGRLTWDDVLLGAHECTHALLLDVGIVFLEGIGESEGDDRQSRIVVCTSLVLFTEDRSINPFEGKFALLPIETLVPIHLSKIKVHTYGCCSRKCTTTKLLAPCSKVEHLPCSSP